MNEYNEKVIKDVLDMKRAEEDAEFLKEIQEAKNNPAFKKKKNETKLFVKEVSRKKNYKPLLRAASIILVVAASLTIVTVSVEGFGEKIVSFFTNFVSSDYIGVKVGTDDDLFMDYQGQFVPSVLPEGYAVESVVNEANKCEILLKNENNRMILIKEQSSDLKSNSDTEVSDLVEKIKINGMDGLLIKKGDVENIYVLSGKTLLYVCDNDPEVDLIGFVELIEKR